MARYGGNTSCVSVTLSDGSLLILDAGTGIRDLGAHLPSGPGPIHLLLSHLHLDHIQGLMFFAPLFDPAREVVVWGPPAFWTPLRERLGRYISAPLSPIEIRELPARVEFREADPAGWTIGPARVDCALVAHRGTTLGYRIADGGRSLCYLPDHEPGLGRPLQGADPRWVSGMGLARDASLLLHDGQYSDEEYLGHVGWGHSSTSDAVAFARVSGAEHTLLFHHDPLHDDDRLDVIRAAAEEHGVGLAIEGTTLDV
jgi:phosphoribosyl 1,2-cyclic phosphodiesterase